MTHLFIALYAEGNTDDVFLGPLLGPLIERTARQLVRGSKGEMVQVEAVFVINRDLLKATDGAGKILQAAWIANRQDILVVHKDSDTQTHKEVLDTRFMPGGELIRQRPGAEELCRNLVPVVPAKMTGGWMLADLQAVLNAVGAVITAKELKAELKKAGLTLPSKPHQVTSIRDPKQMLDQIVRIARTQRNTKRERLYTPLGTDIDLQALERLDSYNQFVNDLRAAIVALGKIQL